MFLNIARAKHRKLQGLQLTRSPPGMSRGWVGGRGRSAYNIRLPGLRQGHGLRGRRLDIIYIYIVELRTPAMPVGVGGGKERGGFHLNLRT